MYIRKTKIKNSKADKDYYTYRIVESQRIGKTVKQVTILNLGTAFDVPQEKLIMLTSLIQDVLQAKNGQYSLFESTVHQDSDIASKAHYYASLILNKISEPIKDLSNQKERRDYQSVDTNAIGILEPRSIGAEGIALHAFTQLNLKEKLTDLGIVCDTLILRVVAA